jgi:hypothetical protein
MKRRNLLTSLIFALAVAGMNLVSPGCGVSAETWIQLALSLANTVLTALPGIITALQSLMGGTTPVLTAAQLAKLTKVFQGAENLFTTAIADINLYQKNADPTLIGKIEDILNQIKSSLGSVLTDVQVTNAALVAKITAAVDSIVGLADTILSVLPSVISGKLVAKKVSKQQMARLAPETWAASFNLAIHKPTGDAAVDAAFAQVNAVEK